MTRLISNADVFRRLGNTWVSEADQADMRVVGHRVEREVLSPDEALRRLRMVHIVNRMRRVHNLPLMDTRPPTGLVRVFDEGNPDIDQFTLASLPTLKREMSSEKRHEPVVTHQLRMTNILLKLHAVQRERGRKFIKVKAPEGA